MRLGSRQTFGKRKKLLIWLLAAVVVLVAGIVLYAIGTNLERAEQERLAALSPTQPPSARLTQRQTLVYLGQEYQLKPNLTTILVIGVDKGLEPDSDAELPFRNGGQADYLSLMVIDDAAKTMQRISIDRDTITDITVFSVLGQEKGTRKAQIALAHGYGRDAKHSAQLTVRAASQLLFDLRIDEYLAFTMDAINVMNEAVGGVSVYMEDDLTAIDPAFVQGRQVLLQGHQAERFVRARQGATGGTNVERMNRQQVFLSAFSQSMVARINQKTSFVNDLLGWLSPYLTDLPPDPCASFRVS
jgi:LCP family protein required for cell wall assembly